MSSPPLAARTRAQKRAVRVDRASSPVAPRHVMSTIYVASSGPSGISPRGPPVVKDGPAHVASSPPGSRKERKSGTSSLAGSPAFARLELSHERAREMAATCSRRPLPVAAPRADPFRTIAYICSSSRIRRKEGPSSWRGAVDAGARAAVAYDGAARVVAGAASRDATARPGGAEGRAVETGGRAGGTGGRVGETRGRAGEAGGRAGETGGKAGETGGRAGETGGGEQRRPLQQGWRKTRTPPSMPAAGAPESRPCRPRGRQDRARPRGDPGSGYFQREPVPWPPRPHAPPPPVLRLLRRRMPTSPPYNNRPVGLLFGKPGRTEFAYLDVLGHHCLAAALEEFLLLTLQRGLLLATTTESSHALVMAARTGHGCLWR